MEEALADYVTFYGGKHANRRLTWAHYLGTATLTAHFPRGKKELSVSLYQAVVLLLFNEQSTWTTQEIQDRISLSVYRSAQSVHPPESIREF
jgi:cullin-4